MNQLVMYCILTKIKLKGCTFHDHFQIALKECQRKRASKEEIKCRLHFHQINVRDENAIVVQALFDNMWQSLGYVPKQKLPKVTRAIQAGEVQDVKLENVFRIFICDVKQYRYVGQVVVVKNGCWEQDDKNYKYNNLI